MKVGGKLANLAGLGQSAGAMPTEQDPEWVTQALCHITDHLSVAKLREICRGLPGSYHKPDAMRFRIKEALPKDAVLRRVIKDAFKECAVCVDILEALDAKAVPHFLPSLLGLESMECVKLALWLNPRMTDIAEALDALGLPRRDPDNFSLVERQQAIGEYLLWIDRTFLQPWDWPSEEFHEALRSVPDWQVCLASMEGESTATEATGSQSSPLLPVKSVHERQGIEGPESVSLVDEIELWKKRLKDVRDRGAAEKRDLEATLTKEREEFQTQSLKDQGTIAELRSRLLDLESRWQTSVDEEVERAIGRKVRPWLSVAQSEEVWIAEHRDDWESLKDEALKVIELQAEEDRRAGNRSQLRKQLDEARTYRTRLAEVARDSLKPLPRIKPLILRIDTRIEELEGRLGSGGNSDTVSESLLTAIAIAESDEALVQLGEAVSVHAALGVVTKAGSERILAAVEERRSLLRDVDVVRTPVVVPATVAGSSEKPERVQPSDVLKGKVAGRILVDVYNMIGRQAAVLKVPEGPESMPLAWKKLKDSFALFARNRPKVEFLLVVDGPHGKIEQWGPNLRVEYSGGAGRDRADEVLLGRVDWLCRESGNAGTLATTFLVSDDQTLRNGALLRGVRWVSTDQFARRLALG